MADTDTDVDEQVMPRCHPAEPHREDGGDSAATQTGAPSAGQSQLVGSQPVDPDQGVEEPDGSRSRGGV